MSVSNFLDDALGIESSSTKKKKTTAPKVGALGLSSISDKKPQSTYQGKPSGDGGSASKNGKTSPAPSQQGKRRKKNALQDDTLNTYASEVTGA